MRFVVDAQLPPALARFLADAGHQAEHTCDIEMDAASDAVIWDYAVANNATIVTKDEYFVIRASISQTGPPVDWIRTGNIGKRALLGWIKPTFSISTRS